MDVDAVVIHYTALEWAETVERLCSPAVDASTHFVIDRDGSVGQLVSVDRKAWHAGVSHLAGRDHVNEFSVGVDLVFVPGADSRYSDAQYRALGALLSALAAVFGISRDRVVGHDHVARPTGRKQDPGPAFDWARVRREEGA
jgi:N-acetyl-anhydromuramyl-L-alanine amidase AmpD